MDHVDPTRIRGFQPPMTSEVASHFKKKITETKMDTTEQASESGDLFELSEFTQSLPDKKKEAFLADAKKEIANLDPESETFMDEATNMLVDSVLKWEFGGRFAKNPGYKQMESVLKRMLLRDPHYRPIIEEFLGQLLESED